MGRRGTASQQSIGNNSNNKRSSGGSVDNNVNNNKRLGSGNINNNNGRLSTGSVKIELDDRFIKEPSFGANEKRNTMSKTTSTKDQVVTAST